MATILKKARNENCLHSVRGVAALRVSGAFSLRDTDASLRLLSDTLPLNISRLTRYWLSVEPRV